MHSVDTLAVGVFLGVRALHCIRISYDDITSSLNRWLTHNQRYAPLLGAKNRDFLLHHSGTASPSVTTLRKLKPRQEQVTHGEYCSQLIDRSWLLVGMVSKSQKVDRSILDPILDQFWTNRNLYINKSSQFGPKKDFGPFLTVGSYQTLQVLCSNIMFFIITATTIYQEQAEDKNKVQKEKCEVQKHKRAMKPWWSQPNQKNGPFQYISKTIVIYI